MLGANDGHGAAHYLVMSSTTTSNDEQKGDPKRNDEQR